MRDVGTIMYYLIDILKLGVTRHFRNLGFES